jgi:hypothetical protein
MQSNESNFKGNPTSLDADERQKWLQALAVNMVALNKYIEEQAKVNFVQPQVNDDNVHSKHEHSQAMHEHVQVHQGQVQVHKGQVQVHQGQVQVHHDQVQVHHDQVQVRQEQDREKILIKHEQALSLKFRITDASKGFYEYESLSEEEKEALPKTTLEVMRDVANMVEGPRK